jgi:hypothetical protein
MKQFEIDLIIIYLITSRLDGGRGIEIEPNGGVVD